MQAGVPSRDALYVMMLIRVNTYLTGQDPSRMYYHHEGRSKQADAKPPVAEAKGMHRTVMFAAKGMHHTVMF